MNGTKTGAEYSQLPAKGGFLQKNSAEHKGYAGAYSPVRIPENNTTDANESKEGLLEKMVSRDNLNEGFKRVKANKGSDGIDGMNFYNISKRTETG